MADTLTTQSATLATVPASTAIATDDAGASGHVQIVKLALSADGSATPITADASGMLVNLGANNDVTVTGTVAVTQSGTWDEIGINDSGNSITVDNAALSVTGGGVEASALRVTLASDSTGVVGVNDNGGSLTVDGAVAATQSGTWTVQPGNTANTTAWKVDGSAVTQPVSGTVTANAGSGTMAVSLASVPSHAVTNAGTFATQVDGAALTSLQLIDDVVKTEDAAHSSGDVGVMALAVRRDANTTLADTTGDYAPLQVDASGSLKVAITAGAGSGGTSLADEAAFTLASTSFTPIGGVYNATPDTLADGAAGAAQMTTARGLHVHLVDVSGASQSVGGGTQYTEDAAAAANPVGNALIVIREDGRAGSLTSADGDNVALRGNNLGELYVKHTDAIPVTDNGGSLTVDGTVAVSGTVTVGSHAVTNAGTFATQVDGAALTALQLIDNLVLAEDAAHTTADPGVQMLAVRKATPANVSGTDGDYEPLQVSAGRLWASATIDSALPAGTNAIGKLASNTGVTIGAVEIAAAQTLATVTNVATIGTSVTPGTSAAHLGKAEDAAHSSGDTGVMALAVRVDTPGTSAGADGDYAPVQVDAAGAVRVSAPRSSTSSAIAQTTQGTTAAQVLAANAARKLVMIQNTGTTILRFALGSGTPTATVYHFALAPAVAADDGSGAAWVSDVWTGAVQAISSGASGQMVVTELT